MKNITLSIDDDLLKNGRLFASKHQMSFNSLVRKLVEQTAGIHNNKWLDDAFAIISETNANSQGKKWTRAELHRG